MNRSWSATWGNGGLVYLTSRRARGAGELLRYLRQSPPTANPHGPCQNAWYAGFSAAVVQGLNWAAVRTAY